MRIVSRVVALVALWLLAWGEISVKSVVSGIAVAGALLVAFPLGSSGHVRIHPIGVARLLAYVGAQLVSSNVVMTRQILRPQPSFTPGVLAHHLDHPSPEVVTAMTSVIALSPGTMTVDVASDSTRIYVHFLLLDDVGRARDSLNRLERLVVAAIAWDLPLAAPRPGQEEPS